MKQVTSPRIVITGGSGFIGSNVVDVFLEHNYQVVVLDKNKPHTNEVIWHKVNVANANLTNILKKDDFVFHFAGNAKVGDVNRYPLKALYSNYVSVGNVLHYATSKKIKQFIFASSILVANTSRLIKNDRYFFYKGANNFYVNQKIAAELLVQSWASNFKLKCLILRIGNPIGPRMREDLVVHKFITMMMANKPIIVYGDGKQIRKFFFVRDIGKACIQIVKKYDALNSQIFNITGNQSLSIIQLVKRLEKILHTKAKIIYKRDDKSYSSTVSLNNNSTVKFLDWHPLTIENALERTIKWYKDNRQ